MEEIGGSIGADPKLIDDELDTYLKEIVVYAPNARTIHTTEAKKRVRDYYLGIILFSAADRNETRGRPLQDLKNDSFKGQSIFPGITAEAFVILNDYSDTASTLWATDRYYQVAFTHKEDADPTTHKKTLLR